MNANVWHLEIHLTSGYRLLKPFCHMACCCNCIAFWDAQTRKASTWTMAEKPWTEGASSISIQQSWGQQWVAEPILLCVFDSKGKVGIQVPCQESQGDITDTRSRTQGLRKLLVNQVQLKSGLPFSKGKSRQTWAAGACLQNKVQLGILIISKGFGIRYQGGCWGRGRLNTSLEHIRKLVWGSSIAPKPSLLRGSNS